MLAYVNPCPCGGFHPANKHDLIDLATKAQVECVNTTRTMRNKKVCEVCGGPHPTYECCETCNLDVHTCRACGDNLGHADVSACYIIMKDQNDRPEEWRMTCEA